jgi:xanthine dehydrogenase small subunit
MTIRFLLNDTEITRSNFAADETLLDFLRIEASLTGTKEGCNEGDCGACTVLVGRLAGDELVYEGLNACIRFTGTLHGCHVVTVEHLSPANAKLHPVQQALVDHHGSQCGFCTPGFVMSLYGLWMHNATPNETDVERALQGNLCRCTGYRPIVDAALAIQGKPNADPLVVERANVIAKLKALQTGERILTGKPDSPLIIPVNETDFATALIEHPNATIVAGATDVGLWVTKGFRKIAPMIYIGGLSDLQNITHENDALRIGAGVSYTKALSELEKLHPAMGELLWRIGGDQVRNAGTIGGNIAGGSPIGDTPPPLIALGAIVELRKGDHIRQMPLEEFFIAYGKQARETSEFVRAVIIPEPKPNAHFAAYKISKRRDEDISALLGAFHIQVENGLVASARICFGGMAGTPKRASHVEADLTGKPWNQTTINAALPAFGLDYQPLTDMRATANYRLMVAKNLLQRFFLEHAGDAQPIRLETYHAA